MFDPLLCYIDGEQNRENLFIQDEKFTGGDHSVLFFYVNLSPVFIFLGLMNRIQCSFLPQPTAGSESVGIYTAPGSADRVTIEVSTTTIYIRGAEYK